MCTTVLIGRDPATPPHWVHIRWRLLSAKIDDVSLWPLPHYAVRSPSLFGLQVYSIAQRIGWDPVTPITPPPPSHLGSYTRALLVSQDRRRLFVTPCSYGNLPPNFLTSSWKGGGIYVECVWQRNMFTLCSPQFQAGANNPATLLKWQVQIRRKSSSISLYHMVTQADATRSGSTDFYCWLARNVRVLCLQQAHPKRIPT